MKILYLITKAERGGAQQHVRDLAIAFANSNTPPLQGGVGGGLCFVTVAIGEPSGWLYDELHREGIATKYVPLKRGWNPFLFFGFAIRLAKLIWHTQPDIVHFHSSHTLLGAWIVKLFFHPAKSVITLHGLSLLADSSSRRLLEKLIYKFYLSISLRAANAVICVSDADAVIINKLFPFVSPQTIHNGIAVPKFLSRHDARARLGLPLDVFVIGTLGRLAYPKNQEMLLEAFSKCRNTNTVLCLIGEGPDRNHLIARATELGIRDRVVLAKGDATLLQAFDLFVLSSRFEGFPYTLLEAAFARVPIIATDVGGVSEFIENNKTGLLVEYSPSFTSHACRQAGRGLGGGRDGVDGLSHAIDNLISHPNVSQTYAEAAHNLAILEFSGVRMCEKIIRVYQKLVVGLCS